MRENSKLVIPLRRASKTRKVEVNEDDNEERTVTLLNVLHVAD